MYNGVPFSPLTALTVEASATDTRIHVEDSSVFGPVPNIVTLFEPEQGIGETVLMIASGTGFIDVERAAEGIARIWPADTIIGRIFTAKDQNDIQANIRELKSELTGHALTLAGLSNVDNTSDADKPVSGPQETAIADALSAAKTYTAGALLSANAYTDGALTAAKAYTDGKIPAFIYNCTGSNDDVAIRGIVNNFFYPGAAMSMKLIITGTMGVSNPSGGLAGENSYLYLYGSNARGAVCTLDFSACHIPEITTAAGPFLDITPGVKVNIFGLYVKTDGIGVRTDSAGCSFVNCTIDCSEMAVSGEGNRFVNCSFTCSDTEYPFAMFGASHSFVDCQFSCEYVSIDGNDNRFLNCRMNCTVVFWEGSGNNLFNSCSTWGVVFGASCQLNRFHDCLITSQSSGVELGNLNDIIMSQCIIKSDYYGVNVSNKATCRLVLLGCTIYGAMYGVYIQTAKTTAEIKLMNCSIKGDTDDIRQGAPASTVKWYITGNSFSKADIKADGNTAITYKTDATIYMPQYANFFSCDITV